MTDNWDFYFLTVDERPASIYVDLDAIERAPVPELPYLAYVRLFMRSPRRDGLSSQDEFETLSAIEDALVALLTPEGASDVGYVGRCTTNGCRDFYFYAASEAGWHERVATALASFPDYQFEAGTQSEPAWNAYFDFLAPGPEDRERIESRRVCASLQDHGDALTAAREIDHFAYFPTVQSRDAYVAAAVQLGYVMRRDEEADDGDADDSDAAPIRIDPAERFRAHLTRQDTPAFDTIDEIVLPLHRLAREHGGRYDGWGTQVVGEEQDGEE